jgi:threonine/homoserine/homoserine lactone efflux protein|tara:strand:+ start:3080 stop:3676 length:597 start_codon:yes stop_codon:yes gene_type:complete
MYPQLIPLIFFTVAAAFTPGPNNIIGSYSGFNFGIKKSLPLILGVTFGYTVLITLVASGLNIIFSAYPVLKIIIKVIGSLFLIYLAYKISFQNKIQEQTIKNPVKFIDTFIFQFINPKGVFAAITSISLFVELGENYIYHSMIVITVSFICAVTSITSWCLLGKFLRRFAENKKFIQRFNYSMSISLIVCVILIYLKI